MAKPDSSSTPNATAYHEFAIPTLEDLLWRVQVGISGIRALAGGVSALISASDVGNKEELAFALHLLRQLDEAALNWIDETDSVNVATLVKGGTA